MKYKVKDVDSESQHSVKSPDDTSRLEEKLERTVRCSSVLIGALGLSLIALGVYTTVLVLGEYKSPRPCLSEECVATASRMLESLNKEVNPCTDFYEFACGGWIKKNPVPEWSTSWDQLAKLREQLVSDLRELLEADDEPDLPASVKKAKSLYRTCNNVEKLEAEGIKPIQKVLEKLGLPPLPPSEPTVNFTWVVPAGRARRMLGLNVLLSVQIAEDVRNTSRNRIVIEQVSPGFSDRYLLQPEQFAHEVAQYRKYIRDVIAIADPKADADRFADDIVDFSKSLAKIMTPVEVRRSGTHLFHEVNVLQLIQGSNGGPAEWKLHDWERYLQLVFSDSDVQLQDADRVIVMDLPYLHRLAALLATAPPLLIERFLWWSVFSTLAPMSRASFRELGFEFSRAVFGLQQRTPRWKACTANVNANFGVALSYLYVRRHFANHSREKAIEMVEDVRHAFADEVEQLDWMDSSTRLKTLRKLRAIRNYVAYPAWLLQAARLDQHYAHQWWSAATLEHYHGKVQCIIEQYSRYHMPQLPNYTGENIADNGGLRAALRARALHAARHPAAARDTLPAMPYSPDQLFFLGFAQIWCGNSTVGALKSKMVEGVHSPNKIRVIGTLSNSKEFADAWQCPLGSPMNPEHKCVLW
ncbi:unnamed protein product [Chilo suppressalis]|uniref:Peptidase M13 N-terminal domain-containing protein n=1 Tax=Chilo suppressalis TaxID=168631 RepID=A0ABN8ASG1_CHISP|nr:unnamed protein product [Chilo suppressalis]